MATIVWQHDTYLKTKAYAISEIKKFNDNALLAGLIEYTGANNLPAITAASTKTIVSRVNAVQPTVANSVFEICSLRYQLPTGDGSIKYGDDVDGYKTVLKESYDSTQTYIRFKFKFVHQPTPQLYASNDGALAATCFITCDINVSRTSTFIDDNDISIFKYDPTFSQVYQNAWNKSAEKLNFNSKTAMIHLGANSLFVSWMDTNANSLTDSVDTIFYYKTHKTSMPKMIFNLYRSNGDISIFYPKWNIGDASNSGLYTTDVYYSKPLVSTIDKFGVMTTCENIQEILQSTNSNYISIGNNDGVNVLNTYTNHYDNLQTNPTVLRMLFPVVVDYSIGYTYCIVKYKGTRVRMKYLTYGKLVNWFGWTDVVSASSSNQIDHRKSSYLFMMNDHELTTGSAI